MKISDIENIIEYCWLLAKHNQQMKGQVSSFTKGSWLAVSILLSVLLCLTMFQDR